MMKNILSILLVSIIMLGCGENNNTNKLERVSIEKLINKGKGADPSGQLGDGKNTNPTDLLIYYKGKLFTGLAFDGKYEMTFKNGKIDGMLESYHNNGQLKNQFNYKNGLQHGLSRIYYNNGQLLMKVNIDSELDMGIAEIYYENGQLRRKTKKENGIYVYKLCWDKNGNKTDCN